MLKILKSMKNQNKKGILIAIAMLMTLWVQGLKAQSKEDSLKIKKLFENKNITYAEVDKKIISLLYNYGLPSGMDGKYFKECFLEK